MTINITRSTVQHVQLTVNCNLPNKTLEETNTLIKENKCTHCSCGKIDSETNECDRCLTSKKLMELEIELQRVLWKYNNPLEYRHLFGGDHRGFNDYINHLRLKIIELTLETVELQREEENAKTIRFHPMLCGEPIIP